jgi:hypothetical protein
VAPHALVPTSSNAGKTAAVSAVAPQCLARRPQENLMRLTIENPPVTIRLQKGNQLKVAPAAQSS